MSKTHDIRTTTLTSRFSRITIAFFTSAILVAAVATGANAATRMYTGGLLYHAFGNDTDTQTKAPFSRYTYGPVPVGNLICNTEPFHAAETKTFSATTMNAGMTYVTSTWTLFIPDYGGQVPTYTANGMDYAAGCGPLNSGTPLTPGTCEVAPGVYREGCGFATTLPGATSMNPRAITLQPGALKRIDSVGGSQAAYTVYVFNFQTADLQNQTGSFFEGGGPGDFSIQHVTTPTAMGQKSGKVAVQEGPKQFGGVMQLFGRYGGIEGYNKGNHIVVADYDWVFDALGASGQTSGGTAMNITQGSIIGRQNTAIATNDGARSVTLAQASAFPWTTGNVTVTATRGPFFTVQRRAGYDNRTVEGGGTIQLVSPMLTRWIYEGGGYETAAIGVLNLRFVPEPASLSLVGAGVGLLGLLYGANRKR